MFQKIVQAFSDLKTKFILYAAVCSTLVSWFTPPAHKHLCTTWHTEAARWILKSPQSGGKRSFHFAEVAGILRSNRNHLFRGRKELQLVLLGILDGHSWRCRISKILNRDYYLYCKRSISHRTVNLLVGIWWGTHHTHIFDSFGKFCVMESQRRQFQPGFPKSGTHYV